VRGPEDGLCYERAMSTVRHTDSLELDSTAVLLALSGPQNSLLGEVARQSGAEVSLRGNVIYVSGGKEDVAVACRFLSDAAELIGRGVEIQPHDVGRSLRELRADPTATLVELLDEVIVVSPRRRPIVPKSAGQRSYVRLIRTHDLTFGIGPAGTGTTYLAMAMAASASNASFSPVRRWKRAKSSVSCPATWRKRSIPT
jgi:phosphate starvation-inducible PhoH-like protein